MEDIRIDTYTDSSPIVRMTLTHLPTSTFVNGYGKSHFRLKQSLMQLLQEKIEKKNETKKE